jgi:ferredoxin
MVKFKVEIHKSACQGFGACVELCSRFFQLSDTDGKSSFLAKENSKVENENEFVIEDLQPDILECVKKAAESCPFNAIHVTNMETGEKLI